MPAGDVPVSTLARSCGDEPATATKVSESSASLGMRWSYTGDAPPVPSAFELGDVVVGELEVRGDDDRVDLVRPAEAGDRAVDGRAAQRPRDGHRAGLDAVARRDPLQPLDQLEVARELRLPEAVAAPAPVVLGQALDALAGHLPGQEARGHRRVDDHADPVLFAVRQDLRLDLAVEQRVRGLQRLDHRDRIRPLEL